MTRILLVEDDSKIASFLGSAFQENQCLVDCAENGEDGLVMAMTTEFDVAIVDLMLPGIDGLTVIERLRLEKMRFPIIVLSAKRGLEERQKCLHSGADDYVGKPFAFSELLARLQAVLRRSTGSIGPTKLEMGDVVLDRSSREVSRSGTKIDLQPRELALLEHLMLHAGKVMSKTYLLEQLWEVGSHPQTNVVDVLVSQLGNKLDRDSPSKLIHTIRGVGYVLRPPATLVSAERDA
jgi:two-component system, OmpR family, response regulator